MRRVRQWHEMLTLAGFDVVEVDLLRDHRRRLPSAAAAMHAWRGTAVLETAVWSVESATQAVRVAGADVLICATPRAFHPRLAQAAAVAVLDFQDQFSRSYGYRAAIDRRLHVRAGYKGLAVLMRRFERSARGVHRVAAGWTDAQSLNATWVPITLDLSPPSEVEWSSEKRWDFLFFGKLSYAPNIDALRHLAHLWPSFRAALPSVTLKVAGSSPTDEVIALAASQGWTLEIDFGSVTELCRDAAVALVPMRYSTGILIKVLEAAAANLPQVVTPQAVAGMEPGFPAEIAESDHEFVARAVALRRDEARRESLAARARQHVAERYCLDRWACEVHSLLADAQAER
jgi:glycosyltransferase involved in cell wall biosynthesis